MPFCRPPNFNFNSIQTKKTKYAWLEFEEGLEFPAILLTVHLPGPWRPHGQWGMTALTHCVRLTPSIHSGSNPSEFFFPPSSIALWTLAIMPIAAVAVPDYWWDLDGNYTFSEGEKTARLFLIGLKLKRHPSDGGSHPFSILVLSLSTAERFIAASP